MELFDYKNLIQDNTCFKKDNISTLNDVFLTNHSQMCMKSLNFCTGITDCHNFNSAVINTNIAKDGLSKFECKSFIFFNQELFLTYLHVIDFSFFQNADLGADAAYEMFESEISQVVNRHATNKTGIPEEKENLIYKKFFKKGYIFLEIMKKLEMPKHGISIEYREIMLIN